MLVGEEFTIIIIDMLNIGKKWSTKRKDGHF